MGEFYQILAIRDGERATIKINGLDLTRQDANRVHGGDVNCDMVGFIGMQIYDTTDMRLPFHGRIYKLCVYDGAYYDAVTPVVYKPNPGVYNVATMNNETRQHVNLEIAKIGARAMWG